MRSKELPLAVQPEIFVEWLTPAYRQTEKSKGWYVMMGALVLAFVLYGLFIDADGWIVSITFLLMAGVYYWSEMKRVPWVKVVISELGIRFGKQFFQYGEIKSFWILNEFQARYLHLRLYKGVQKDIAILIPENFNLALLRQYLLPQITEEAGKKESLSDQLIRSFGL